MGGGEATEDSQLFVENSTEEDLIETLNEMGVWIWMMYGLGLRGGGRVNDSVKDRRSYPNCPL